MDAATVVAVVFGVMSLGLAALQMVQRDREVREARILDAFRYLTGKSQRRSAGIALLQGLEAPSPRLRAAIVPLLASQACYLLETSKQGGKSIEVQNLTRILTMLEEHAGRAGLPGPALTSLADVHESLRRRVAGEAERGLTLPPGFPERWEAVFRPYARAAG